MGHFNRDGGGSGGFNRDFGGGKRFGGRDGGRPTMHKAVCNECGNNCEVPFRPTGDRPVFCSNCFDKQGGGGSRPSKFSGGRQERQERPRFEKERHRSEDRQMYDAVCAKCGQNCQVPFSPKSDKPVFCENCFEKGGKGGKDSGELMDQIKMLNAKVDKLMKMLAPEIKEEIKKEALQPTQGKEKKTKAKVKPASKKALTKKKK